ncbi:conjugative transposon protein TraM [Bacteroides sp. 519]|uniref:conjugative transposon protein TraM n=1 Tax=Bacteroides sp. 519 TaxID=2302937 RepID=UPI0013D71E51|nr:conjugative transposon protein TraM [Bacteroides sp. 519]NDV56680.1 conjugative transposon protein TraM [Bacteroides sp. 519]
MDEQNLNNEGLPETSAPEVKPEVKKEPPKSVQPNQRSAVAKKELTTAQLQKRRKMIIFPLFFLVFGACLWFIFAPSGKDKEEAEGLSGFNAELPVPKDEGIVGDKRAAYEQDAMRQREESKMRSLQDLSDMFDRQTAQSETEHERQVYNETPELFERNANTRSAASSINSSANAYNDINRQLGTWYEEPAGKTDDQLVVEGRIQELERRLEEVEAQKAAEDEQTALLEKSYAMAAKYMPGTAQPVTEVSQPVETVSTKDKAVVQPVSHVSHNVVSLLSAPMTDDEFISAFSQPRNMGFVTAAGNETLASKNSIRACVYQTITLTSGRELQIRLLEPMRAGNILIPANSIITGACRVSGERMNVTVNSIQYGGNIIPVELQVYDMDGQPGIFVPGSDEINAAKEVAAQLAQSAGTSISITDNAGSQLAADVGKGLIQGASQYVSKKMSVVKVTLKANYGLLLLPKTQ